MNGYVEGYTTESIRRDTLKEIKTELFNDNFQNYKRYGIPKAQLVIADIPYNLGVNAYASSTESVS